MPSTFSKDTTRYTADKLGVIEMKTRKTACSQHNNKSNIFDKSVSPLVLVNPQFRFTYWRLCFPVFCRIVLWKTQQATVTKFRKYLKQYLKGNENFNHKNSGKKGKNIDSKRQIRNEDIFKFDVNHYKTIQGLITFVRYVCVCMNSFRNLRLKKTRNM